MRSELKALQCRRCGRATPHSVERPDSLTDWLLAGLKFVWVPMAEGEIVCTVCGTPYKRRSFEII